MDRYNNKYRVSGCSLLAAMLTFLFLTACEQPDSAIVAEGRLGEKEERNPERWPRLNLPVQDLVEMEEKFTELLTTMSVEQKVAEVIQPEIRDVTVDDMRSYGFGSYFNGGGSFAGNNKHATVADWVALVEAMYQASIDDSLDGIGIPTMWRTDAVHGHNNVIGATIYPDNIGLGAAHNSELIKEIALATAEEVMATGIDWVFAPTLPLCVTTAGVEPMRDIQRTRR
nr:glycoside hydrolase family 3 N-terminal domain-containing protein [Teredinibacter franksiae]